ncbi:thioredoxin family protein [Virgisporangium aliadipatigenens]|uniref:Thioredoxin family protein n=1 Tax=Virgisporangium aliadipatigenens TaxID=741659 RepID=A0A8J3YQ90_9ACTN|nr:glutaredoxin family protein [Virgisporangium aliadipatigenens]GIJ48572.1 thioredoxin family protein [Virgisporangium aliadipatigenens]
MTERVVVYGRTGCHLCDDAKASLERLGVAYTEVDVDTDPELTAEYGDLVPVITVDGKEHGYWRVDEARLIKELGGAPR